MAMAMATLPEELMEEILSRVTVKSLLRFKTASKKYYSLISEDDKFHLKQLSCESKNLILHQMARISEGAVFRYSDIDTYESRKFIFPVETTESCELIGSANGLICLGPGFEDRGGCFIWNPCTGEYKSISLYPDFSSRKKGPCYTRLFGFGYDSISDDYKIIGRCNYGLRIFSLKTNSWKIIDFSWRIPLTVFGFCASYSNGALYWCHVTPPITPHITAFDLAKEKIFFLDLPEKVKFMSFRYPWHPVFDYQGSLCTPGRDSIWVMKEYGNTKSWTKFSTPLEDLYGVPNGISRLGELVYLTTDDYGLGFVKSDTQGRICDGDKARLLHSFDVFEYNESLISPKCFDPK